MGKNSNGSTTEAEQGATPVIVVNKSTKKQSPPIKLNLQDVVYSPYAVPNGGFTPLMYLIGNFEDYHQYQYKCQAGVLTNGFGQTGDNLKSSVGIKEALKNLQKNIVEHRKLLERKYSNFSSLTPNTQGILVSASFNFGHFGDSLSAAIFNKDEKAIKDILPSYNKYRKGDSLLVSEGLDVRRGFECAINSSNALEVLTEVEKYYQLGAKLKELGLHEKIRFSIDGVALEITDDPLTKKKIVTEAKTVKPQSVPATEIVKPAPEKQPAKVLAHKEEEKPKNASEIIVASNKPIQHEVKKAIKVEDPPVKRALPVKKAEPGSLKPAVPKHQADPEFKPPFQPFKLSSDDGERPSPGTFISNQPRPPVRTV